MQPQSFLTKKQKNFTKFMVFLTSLFWLTQTATAEDHRLESALRGLDAAMKRIDVLEAKVSKMSSIEEENKQLKSRLQKADAKLGKASVQKGRSSIMTSAKPSEMEKVASIVPVSIGDNWSGIFFGINAGYGRNSVNYRFEKTGLWSRLGISQDIESGVNDFGGPVAGGVMGYNYRFANNFILGVEADFDYADVTNGLNSATTWKNLAGTLTNYSRVGVDWIGTARGRLGYNLDKFFPYITVGFAYGQLSINNYRMGAGYYGVPLSVASTNWIPNGLFSKIGLGWVAGAGAEYMVADNWSIKGEYLYTQISSLTGSDTQYYFDPEAYASNTKITYGSFGIHQLRVGLNYHLNFIK